MSQDFTTMRVRRHVLAHARELELALREEGYKGLPRELHGILRDGGLSALTDAAYHLLASELRVDLSDRDGASDY